MELIGGLVIVAILAAATWAGVWAKRNPSAPATEDGADLESEWSNAIR